MSDSLRLLNLETTSYCQNSSYFILLDDLRVSSLETAQKQITFAKLIAPFKDSAYLVVEIVGNDDCGHKLPTINRVSLILYVNNLHGSRTKRGTFSGLHSVQWQFLAACAADPQNVHTFAEVRKVCSQQLHLLCALHRPDLHGHV